MKVYQCTIKGISPLSWSRFYENDVPKLEKEIAKDYEERTWQNRIHVDDQDNIFIPGASFKKCLEECAQFLSIQIPGKGKSTYTKHFLAGIGIYENATIGKKRNEISKEWFLVPSNGRRGDGTRVQKCFPRIDGWGATFEINIFDETITTSVLKEHIEQAGRLIGLGRYRPRNGGSYGRFILEDLREI